MTRHLFPVVEPVVLMKRIAAALVLAGAVLAGPGAAVAAVDPGMRGGFDNHGEFVVTPVVFEAMFPDHTHLYGYRGLLAAARRYPGFTGTGSETVRRQEAAAFLANVSHETGGLRYVEERDRSHWRRYCDLREPFGCPAGRAAYHGRGPIQLSWNANYRAAGLALGVDLLHHPDLVATDPVLAWRTAVWYWLTGTGNGAVTGHDAMLRRVGFGATIRAVNEVECDGGYPAEVQDRVRAYRRFAALLGVPPGDHLTC
jgi:hypothetical protein